MYMSEAGGFESAAPDEGVGSGGEQVSEQAKERFQQAQQQIKQILREEKKARKRDDRVARTIVQFLGDEKYAHLFQLISRLVARDCPSIFILALLSLIHQGSLEAVEDYIAEHRVAIEEPTAHKHLFRSKALPEEVQQTILRWITRLQLVLSIDAEKILIRLMVDEGNIDGTVLQLTAFVLVDFFESLSHPIPYEQLQPIAVKILQDTIEPHLGRVEQHFQSAQDEKEEGDEDDEDA